MGQGCVCLLVGISRQGLVGGKPYSFIVRGLTARVLGVQINSQTWLGVRPTRWVFLEESHRLPCGGAALCESGS